MKIAKIGWSNLSSAEPYLPDKPLYPSLQQLASISNTQHEMTYAADDLDGDASEELSRPNRVVVQARNRARMHLVNSSDSDEIDISGLSRSQVDSQASGNFGGPTSDEFGSNITLELAKYSQVASEDVSDHSGDLDFKQRVIQETVVWHKELLAKRSKWKERKEKSAGPRE